MTGHSPDLPEGPDGDPCQDSHVHSSVGMAVKDEGGKRRWTKEPGDGGGD